LIFAGAVRKERQLPGVGISFLGVARPEETTEFDVSLPLFEVVVDTAPTVALMQGCLNVLLVGLSPCSEATWRPFELLYAGPGAKLSPTVL
jgi:hypothetical protein